MTIEPMKVELTVGITGQSGRLLLAGVDVSNHVRSVRIDASVDAPTSVTVDFTIVDVVVDATAVIDGVAVPIRPVSIALPDGRVLLATEWHRAGNAIVIDAYETVVRGQGG